MSKRSYFSCDYSQNNSYIIVYPFDTLQILNLFSPETEIKITNLYIEEGEMLIDSPCPVYTDNDFKTILKIIDIKQFLNSKNNLFVMQFEFELHNQNIKIKIDDDIRVDIQFQQYSKEQYNNFLKNVIANFQTYNQNNLLNNISQDYGKYVCINEIGKVWKIINSYSELLDDQEVLATY